MDGGSPLPAPGFFFRVNVIMLAALDGKEKNINRHARNLQRKLGAAKYYNKVSSKYKPPELS